MPYTITIADNNPQALHLVRYLKTLDFVKVTSQSFFIICYSWGE